MGFTEGTSKLLSWETYINLEGTLESMGIEDEVGGNGTIRVKAFNITESPSLVRPFIQKRLDFAHRAAGLEPDTMVRFDDSAFKALEEITHGNPGFIQYACQFVMPFGEQPPKELPYVITGEMVQHAGITREGFEKWWIHGRHVKVIHMGMGPDYET